MKPIKVFVVFILMLNTINLNAQIEWVKNYGGSDVENPISVIETKDKGSISIGYTKSADGDVSNFHGLYDFWVVKLDSMGNLQWQKTYGGTDVDIGYDIIQTDDNGYFILGFTKSIDGDVTLKRFNYEDIWLINIDSVGNILWQKTYGGNYDDRGIKIMNGGGEYYYIASNSTSGGLGEDKSENLGSNDIWIFKINKNGDIVWEKSYGGSGSDWPKDMIKSIDDGILIAGSTKSNDYYVNGSHWVANISDIWIFKIDTLGNFLWQKCLGGTSSEGISGIAESNSGDIYLAGYSSSKDGDLFPHSNDNVGWIVKLDSIGNIKRQGIFGAYDLTAQCSLNDIYVDSFSNIYLTGNDMRAYKEYNDTNVLILLKLDTALNIISYISDEKLPQNLSVYGNKNIVALKQNKGYLVTGYIYPNQRQGDFGFVKISPLFDRLNSNTLMGNVFYDVNQNCIHDSTETVLANQLLQITPGPFYATTTNNGNFVVYVDTGTYTIIPSLTPNSYSEATCIDSVNYYTAFFPGYLDTSSSHTIPFKINLSCPYLEIDFAAPRMRRCFQNIHYGYYCNKGTATAYNAYVEIYFGEYIIPVTSTITMQSTTKPYTYRFLLGNVEVGKCGYFMVYDSVSCNAPLLSTQCIITHVYPDSLCKPTDPQWDHSSIKVEGDCVRDSVARFVIYNTGNPGDGDMDGTSVYRIYVNNQLYKQTSFQLAGGDSLVIEIVTKGNTIRMEADQHQGHPGKSHPRATVELCYPGVTEPPVSITSVPIDDDDPFISIDCEPVVGSYDPNEKSVVPSGITLNKYISDKDELFYHIDFQNTGSDTAFKVVVRDTLSEFLDPLTIVSGASSHPYTFKLYGKGILEWTFDNILLPDSNTNETQSHGFVKYHISQKPGNPKNTLINNRASIYFDYNEPVITNYTANVVYDTIIVWQDTLITVEKRKLFQQQKEVLLYPNPATKKITCFINHYSKQDSYEIEINGIMGNRVKLNKLNNQKNEIDLSVLKNGVYFYKVIQNGIILQTGKIMLFE